MKTFYLVCKVEYEYNDETYYRPNSDAVSPKFVFNTPEAANKRCLELNLLWLEDLAKQKSHYDRGLSDYAYDIDDIFTNNEIPAEFQETVEMLKGWEDTNTFLKQLPSLILLLKPEEQMRMIESLRVVGWEVREVEEG